MQIGHSTNRGIETMANVVVQSKESKGRKHKIPSQDKSVQLYSFQATENGRKLQIWCF